ncbi:hypothetical protein GCM10009121_16740 [Rhodanobacter soli]
MPVRAQAPGQAEAVFTGQADIQDHDIDRFAVYDVAHADAVAGCADAKTLAAEVTAEDMNNLGIVIDHQQVCREDRG